MDYSSSTVLWTSWWFVLLIIWSIIWKGIALWKAGRANQMAWFIVMFLLNTAGILEILYIFVFGKKKAE